MKCVLQFIESMPGWLGFWNGTTEFMEVPLMFETESTFTSYEYFMGEALRRFPHKCVDRDSVWANI